MQVSMATNMTNDGYAFYGLSQSSNEAENERILYLVEQKTNKNT